MRRLRPGSLIVVGSGINGVGQTTLEAAASIARAEQVFYLVVEPTTELWIQRLNPSSRTLSDLYAPGKNRLTTYEEMEARIVEAVQAGKRVCAVFYGHPGVLVQASHRAIRRLRRQGFPARMLPGVSSDGCLFADLGLNPGDRGLQSFEATDFLLFRRRFDSTSALILWQIGVLGEPDARPGSQCRPERLQVLTARLLRVYPQAHRVVLYYAPTFPAHPPVIKRIPLARLPRTVVSPQAMLYVPPLPPRRFDRAIQSWFDEAVPE